MNLNNDVSYNLPLHPLISINNVPEKPFNWKWKFSDIQVSSNYTCEIKNSVGSDYLTHIIHITSAPRHPMISLTHATHSSLNLTIHSTENGGAPVLGERSQLSISFSINLTTNFKSFWSLNLIPIWWFQVIKFIIAYPLVHGKKYQPFQVLLHQRVQSV